MHPQDLLADRLENVAPRHFLGTNLLPENAEFIAVRLVNTSSFPFRLAVGQLTGEDRTAISAYSGPLRADRVRPERPPDRTGFGRIRPDKAVRYGR